MREGSTASPELEAIADFLRACVPFDTLDPGELSHAVANIRVSYHRAGEHLPSVSEAPRLSLVRTGAVDIRGADGELMDRCGPGDSFGAGTLLAGRRRDLQLRAIEDTLLYNLGEDAFHRLRAQNRDFERFFHRQQARRLRRAVFTASANQQLSRRVNDVMTPEPLSCAPDISVFEAAALMNARRVSSLLVCDDATLCGILTDRDLRSRVLGEGRGGDTRVRDVMSREPYTVPCDALVFDALMTMGEREVHHLPVVRDGRPVGIVTATDLLKAQRSDPVYVIHDISRAVSADCLADLPEAVRTMTRHWVESGARPQEVGKMLSSVSDAATRRLIQLAEEELGPPPVPYAWLGFGSQGRGEQAIGSDQDNALLLNDAFEACHADYFAALADRVCNGLAVAGYRLCPGEIMASNPKWRQTLSAWRRIFEGWITAPTSSALMHASIFFDLRCISGDPGLVGQLQAFFLPLTRDNSIFIACLCENVMQHTPPLGFFRTFLLEKSGDHAKTLDLKHRGVIPIVDIARLNALAAGIDRIGTLGRLEALAEAGAMTRRDARGLADAYQYISRLRLEHQARQLAAGEAPDNYMFPDELSALGREQLREAFELVRDAQKALVMKFGHRTA